MVKFSIEIHLVDSCIHVTTPDGFLRNEDCFKQKYFVCGIDQSEIFIEHPTGDFYFEGVLNWRILELNMKWGEKHYSKIIILENYLLSPNYPLNYPYNYEQVLFD